MYNVKTVYDDITAIECDAIVNSVGVNTKIYGGICGAILNRANSKELESIIHSVDDVYTVGDIFVTDGYELLCSKIVHVITPHHDNDKSNKYIVEIIRQMLNECQRRGLYKVAIPMIGCGANKYDSDKIHEYLLSMCGYYSQHYPEMNFILVRSPDSIKAENDERLNRHLNREGVYHTKEEMKKFLKGMDAFSSENKPNSGHIDLSKKEYFNYQPNGEDRQPVSVPDRLYESINEYVDSYIIALAKSKRVDEKFIKRRLISYFGYGTSSKGSLYDAGKDNYKKCTAKAEASRDTFFKIVLGLKMNKKEAEDFLNYFGLSFAHTGVSILDDIIKELVDRQMYGIIDANNMCKEKGIEPIFVIKKAK